MSLMPQKPGGQARQTAGCRVRWTHAGCQISRGRKLGSSGTTTPICRRVSSPRMWSLGTRECRVLSPPWIQAGRTAFPRVTRNVYLLATENMVTTTPMPMAKPRPSVYNSDIVLPPIALRSCPRVGSLKRLVRCTISSGTCHSGYLLRSTELLRWEDGRIARSRCRTPLDAASGGQLVQQHYRHDSDLFALDAVASIAIL